VSWHPNRVLGLVRRTDLFEPATLAWRRVTDTPQFREYRAVTLLLPDARVLTTGGTRIKFQIGAGLYGLFATRGEAQVEHEVKRLRWEP